METKKRPVGRPSIFSEKMTDRVYDYIEQCKDRWEERKVGNVTKDELLVEMPSMQGLARYLGVSLRIVNYWCEQGEEKDENDEYLYPEKRHFLRAVNMVMDEQGARLINGGLSRRYDNKVASLLLSANHGMVFRSDISTKDKEIENGSPAIVQYVIANPDEADKEAIENFNKK